VPKPNVQLLVDIMGLFIARMLLLIWLPPWPLPLLLQGIHRLSGHWSFFKIQKFISFQKKNKPSFNPARRLQQGQRVLLPNGMVAFAMPVRLPFKVHHFHGINVSSFKQKA